MSLLSCTITKIYICSTDFNSPSAGCNLGCYRCPVPLPQTLLLLLPVHCQNHYLRFFSTAAPCPLPAPLPQARAAAPFPLPAPLPQALQYCCSLSTASTSTSGSSVLLLPFHCQHHYLRLFSTVAPFPLPAPLPQALQCCCFLSTASTTTSGSSVLLLPFHC